MPLRIPLFSKILILSILILLSALVPGYLLLRHSMLRQTRQQVERDNVLLLEELSRSLSLPLLQQDRLAIEDHLGIFERSRAVMAIRVFDRNGNPEGHVDNSIILSGHSENAIPDSLDGDRIDPHSPPGFTALPGRSLTRLVSPVRFQHLRVGTVVLYLSDAPYEAVERQITRSFLELGLGSIFAAFLGSLFLSGYISTPIRTLSGQTVKVLEGRYDPIILPQSRDETGDLVGSFNAMLKGLEHKELLEKALVRYVSREVALHLIAHPELIHLGGIRQEALVLFADIRNFTRLADRLPPEEVVQILNDYFNSFIDDIFSYGGSVNNIMGDGIMIVFGIPEFLPGHPDSALECALSMRRKILSLTRSRLATGLPAVEFGFGLHIGEGVVGHIGSKTRMEYTVVGKPVNVAYRIQSGAAPGEILVSRALRERATPGRFVFSGSSFLALKGLSEKIEVHSLEDPDPEDNLPGPEAP